MSDGPAPSAGFRLRTAIIGAGWAGMAAAVTATQAGHAVTIWEAARILGGRARCLPVRLPNGAEALVDNGQHILIGAYSECLRLMRLVGVDPESAMARLPLALVFPNGDGIRCPDWRAPLDVLAGIMGARGWSLRDKLSLTRAAVSWQMRRFQCPTEWTVAGLCASVTHRVMRDLIDPLCVSALNSPPETSSAAVFLRVMRDAVFGAPQGSNLLLPRTDLSSLFPDAAARWVERHGALLHRGQRVRQLGHDGRHWQVDGDAFDQVILATAAPDAIHILEASAQELDPHAGAALRDWATLAAGLEHAAISTVYAWAAEAVLPRPMLALRSSRPGESETPAQFVFDRGQLGGPQGLLAFVVSTSIGDRDQLQSDVIAQARSELGLVMQPVTTVTDKRATIVCRPGLVRPPMQIAQRLYACGDYVAGPYPSTLEGAVACGVSVIRHASTAK